MAKNSIWLVIVLFLSIFNCANLEMEPKSTSLYETNKNAFEIIKLMGPGFNIGNTFENGKNPTTPEVIFPIIDMYIEEGMKHVRIPVTWLEGFGGDALADDKGKVDFNHPRFLELRQVIDYALNKDLYVVINAHHERELKDNYQRNGKYEEQFRNLWTDIALHFRDYSQKLIFELLNEPEGAFGDHKGEGPQTTDEDALALTRDMYTQGWSGVRKTSGQNKQRIIMISTNGYGNHTFIDEVYPDKKALPGKGKDKYLAIQVHSYDPWDFCGQDGDNSAYPGKEIISSKMKEVIAHGRKIGTPVNYGEYGVGRADDQQERNTDVVKEYYRTVVSTAWEENMSSTAWDDHGWFGLTKLDKQTGKYYFVYDIVPFMLD